MQKTIYFISGLTDIEKAGNQSFKNTLKYLSEFGYDIKVFTFMPSNYPNLQNPREVFNNKVDFHRINYILSNILMFGKKIKDVLGKRSIRNENEIRIGYLSEYKRLGRIFYMGYLFLFYLPLEFVRVLCHSLKKRPDLLYGVNCQGALVASILGRFLQKPVITRFHGPSVIEKDLASWSNKLFVLDELAGLVAPSDAIIMTNDGLRGDRVLRALKIGDDRIHFWINGIDEEDLAPCRDLDLTDLKKDLGIHNKKIILMTSRLVTWKRAERGIYCANDLIKKHNIKDSVLVICGDGPEREDLEQKAGDLGIKEFVKFCGAVPHKEIFKYFLIADIFISLYDISNLGNPLLEAMYFGLPIATIDDGSTEGILIDGQNSVLVSKDKISDELPLKIKRLLENENLRKELGRAARITFDKQILTWKGRVALEDKLIRDLLNKKNS